MTRGRRVRRGLGALEVLLAASAAVLVVGLAYQAVSLVGRSGSRAAWSAEAEHKLESTIHVLRVELARANHLVAREPGTGRLHDPFLSAVWILEEGRGVAFRCFANDQEVADPARLDVEALVQDRVLVVLRGDELVFVRRGRIRPPETRVLLGGVKRLAFKAGGGPRGTAGGGGTLELEVELADPHLEVSLARQIGFGLAVPALDQGQAGPATAGILPPPGAGRP